MTGDTTESPGVQPRSPHLAEAGRQQAMARWQLLRPVVEDGAALAAVARSGQVPERTLRRWLAAYRAGGLAALARRPRSDSGTRRMPPELQLLIEGLALRRPPPAIATVHRQVAEVARAQGWTVPGYAAVYDVVTSIDPAMATLAHEGSKRYKEVFDLVYRREAAKPNQIWQADHTLLDLWVLTLSRPSGPAVADPDRGRLFPRGRRVRGQPGSALGADHRAGVPAGDLAQTVARLAGVRHPRRVPR